MIETSTGAFKIEGSDNWRSIFQIVNDNVDNYDEILGNKKNLQTPVESANVAGDALAFVSDVTQDAQGIITPVRKNVSVIGGATANDNGTSGLVPAPAAGDQEKYLKGDGTWSVVQQRSSSDIVNLIYPVGSIYMSVNEASPNTLFGGIWEQLKDKFLLGAGDTYTAGDTGGAASHTLTLDEMPSHSHSFTGSSVTSGGISANHTHTGTSGNPSANHSHSGPNHSHTYWTALYIAREDGHATWGDGVSGGAQGAYGNYGMIPQQSTNGGGTGSTGTVSAWHTHTTTTGNQSQGHTHTVTANGSIGNSGGGNSFGIMPPYLSVYMWKRVA